METVGPAPLDDDLHLLYEWGDPYAHGRHRTAGIASVLVHSAVIAVILLLPSDFLAPEPEPPAPKKTVIVTPLVEPLTEFTQKAPNKAKVNREIDMASLQPRQRIQTPAAPPSTTRPMAPRPAEIPPAPPPRPAAPLPEPPKIEASAREAPKLDLPAGVTEPVAPPQIQTVEKPKMVLENVGGPVSTPPPGQNRLPVPNTSVADAIRQNVRGTAPGGGLVVGDPGAGPGGIGVGINQAPSPGVPGTALELKSDAMGVDFKPYLSQILVTIKRNWMAVYPESARLGRRGKVGLYFVITKTGKVDKVTWAYQSGADALDRAAVAAISASNPFPPLPGEFKGEKVVLQLNFAYNMPKP
jgi:TonB family protein